MVLLHIPFFIFFLGVIVNVSEYCMCQSSSCIKPDITPPKCNLMHLFLYFLFVTLCICYFVAKPLRHVCGWPPDLCFHLSVRCSQPSCSALAGGAETEGALVWRDGWSGAQELSSALFSAGFLQRLFLHQTDKPQSSEPHRQVTGWGNAWNAGWAESGGFEKTVVKLSSVYDLLLFLTHI